MTCPARIATLLSLMWTARPALAQDEVPAEAPTPSPLETDDTDSVDSGPQVDVMLDPSLFGGLGVHESEPIDRIVAIVGDRLVTSSDMVLEEVLARHDPSPLPVVRARQLEVLDWLVDAAVIRGLAADVSIYQPTAAQVRERAERLRSGFAAPAEYESFLGAFGLDEDSLEGILYTRLVVERYIARNLDLRERSDAAGSPTTRYALWIRERRASVPVRLVERTEVR